MTGDTDRNREREIRGEDERDHGGGGDRPRGGGGRGRGGRNDRDDEGPPPSDPLRDDDSEPGDRLRQLKEAKARAETTKPIEPILEGLLSGDPEKDREREGIEKAYAAAAATTEPAGSLRAKYRAADRAFKGAAEDMLATRDEQSSNRLERWLRRNLRREGAPVRKLLIERRQVAARLGRRSGPRELELEEARENTARWSAAWTAWSDPAKNIDAVIDSYADRIGTLKDLINDEETANKAILEFWFEVAPLHLGLRRMSVTERNAPGSTLVLAALTDFPDVQALLASGEDRGDGSLYLIDPANNALRDKREHVLQAWEDAAIAEAVAAAAYELRPDAAADLARRNDDLEGDKWIARAKGVLGPPATP